MEATKDPATKGAANEDVQPPAPEPQSPPTALEPLPERDLELVDLPTEFDPDAEPIPTARRSSLVPNDGEDTLEVPIRSAEDEDAEEAAALAEIQKRRNGGQEEEGDEDDGNLEELLRGLQGDEDGEIEGGDDEILAEMPVEETQAEIILGEETVAESEPVEQSEAPMPVYQEQIPEEEDIQMNSTFSSPLSDLPDLPSELPASPQPVPPTPSRAMPKRILSPQAESHAESSLTGAKRARLASVDRELDLLSQPKVNPMKSRKRKEDGGSGVTGKRPRKQVQELDFDDLESISDGETLPSTDKKATGRNANGRPKPPRKKKADGAFSISVAGTGPKAPPRLTDTQLRNSLKGKDRERQYGPCLRPRYKGWGKCTQCVGKVGGDSCRFRNFRMFKIDPDTGDISDVAEFEYTRLAEDMTPLPKEFNAPWTEDDIFRTERTIASMLLPVISREMRHAVNMKAIVRESDPAKHRGVCDFCSSTIFGGFFFCQKCGKDYCLQCERYFSDSMEAIRESPWDLPDAARPRLLRCTLAPPAKGTLAGKPPAVSLGVEKVDKGWEIVQPVSDDRNVPAPEELRRTDANLPTMEVVEGQSKEAVPTTESISEDRPPIDTLAADQSANAAVQTETSSSVAIVADATSTESAVTTAVNTQENTQEDVEAQPSHGTIVLPSSDSSLTEPIASLPPTLEPRHRPTTYKIAAPVAARVAAKRSTNFHVRPDLIPVTRFHATELEEHWYKLVAFVLDGTGSLEDRMKWFYPAHVEVDKGILEKVKDYIERYPTTFPSGPSATLTDEEKNKYYVKTTNPSIEPIPDPAGLRDKSHPFMFVQATELDNELFDRLWARGEPIVVDKVGDKFKQTWTPDTFIERFGEEGCFVIDCETEAIKETSVGKFFEMFKDPAQRAAEGVWKLKDWPSTHDFQSAYPDLYNDFCDSLPVPDFTRREGVLNLYAHFPSGPTKPDIGPKMYNAFEGEESAGGQGSTRLHMDVADAINIMLYASPRPDGQPGCAVWDLFKAEDADTIREFLKDKYGGKVLFTDPIHSQVFYLDSELRKELDEKHGVVSFRVYQYPGQAVFIPAGCAHQVCNLADCIKIALDFVSPHNVSRCQQLMHDFRKENYIKAWKDDVLQLYNVMWFSWLNARETRARRLEESKAPKHNSNDKPNTKDNTNGPDRPRWLATQVSAVRDEPTSSPLHSRPPSPEPDEKEKEKEKEDTQTKDRLEISELLFEAMLLQSDTPPPAPIEENKDKHKDETNENNKDPGIRTSALVKMGVLPVDLAYYGVLQSMKSEGTDGGLENLGMVDEFRLGLDGL